MPSTSMRRLNLCWAPRLYILADQLTGCNLNLSLSLNLNLDLSLCWAPRLYILADQLSGSNATLAPVACNDDFCGYLSQLTVRPMRPCCRPGSL